MARAEETWLLVFCLPLCKCSRSSALGVMGTSLCTLRQRPGQRQAVAVQPTSRALANYSGSYLCAPWLMCRRMAGGAAAAGDVAAAAGGHPRWWRPAAVLRAGPHRVPRRRAQCRTGARLAGKEAPDCTQHRHACGSEHLQRALLDAVPFNTHMPGF